MSLAPMLSRIWARSSARSLSTACLIPPAIPSASSTASACPSWRLRRVPTLLPQCRSMVTAIERLPSPLHSERKVMPVASESLLSEAWSHRQKRFSTKNICGPKFWRSRRVKVPVYKFNWRSKWLEGAGRRKGICVKVLVMNPKKPNSGLRKIAKVQLPNKRLVRTYIPGIGHNLQAHSVVLVQGGRTADVRGCNYKLVRGAYDLLPVKGRMRARSRYGVKRPKTEHMTTRFKWVTTEEDRVKFEKRTGLQVKPDEQGNPVPVPRPPWPLFRKKPPVVTGYGRKKAR